jgi:YesN/AraC family two-component response regulator
MVCDRCKSIIKSKLDEAGIIYDEVSIGEVTIRKKLTAIQHRKLFTSLKHLGFELIDDKKNALIEKLKSSIAMLERCSDGDLNINYADFISMNVNDNFISLNTLFSEIEGMTIEKYIIRQKVETVKELLGHNNYTIAEIAVRMHYESVTQLSSQFKSITGLTPLHFKQLRHINSKPNLN